MIFGYVWKDPRAIKEATQRQYAHDAGARARDVKIEKSPAREWRRDLVWGDRDLEKGEKPAPLLRKGDVVAVYRTRYIADDSLDFVELLVALARIGAGLHITNAGVTVFPDRDMSELIEQDINERRKQQTEPARKARMKSKRKGGPNFVESEWDEEKQKRFRQCIALPRRSMSDGEIAREFEISKPSVNSVRKRMKLPERENV